MSTLDESITGGEVREILDQLHDISLEKTSFFQGRFDQKFAELPHDPLLESFEGMEGRIGVVGGTLDMLHLQHIEIGKAAKLYRGLDKIVYCPNPQSPSKLEKSAPASVLHRLAIARLSLYLEENFYVSPLEYQLHGLKGSARAPDTMQHIRSQLAEDAELFFIAGPDVLGSIPTWKNPERLFEAAQLIVVRGRQDYDFDQELGKLAGVVSPEIVESIRDNSVPVRNSSVSSSCMKELLLEPGDPRKSRLAPLVPYYLSAFGLYGVGQISESS